MPPKVVPVTTSDGKMFQVPVAVVEMSSTLRNLRQEQPESIDLEKINSDTFELVLTYCKYHVDHPVPRPPSPKRGRPKPSNDISPWDKEFINLTQGQIFQVLLAANYLDIPPLLQLAAKTVANNIKGKTPEEIRENFEITNDFTPEEEEQTRRENKWVEDLPEDQYQ